MSALAHICVAAQLCGCVHAHARVRVDIRIRMFVCLWWRASVRLSSLEPDTLRVSWLQSGSPTDINQNPHPHPPPRYSSLYCVGAVPTRASPEGGGKAVMDPVAAVASMRMALRLSQMQCNMFGGSIMLRRSAGLCAPGVWHMSSLVRVTCGAPTTVYLADVQGRASLFDFICRVNHRYRLGSSAPPWLARGLQAHL